MAAKRQIQKPESQDNGSCAREWNVHLEALSDETLTTEIKV